MKILATGFLLATMASSLLIAETSSLGCFSDDHALATVHEEIERIVRNVKVDDGTIYFANKSKSSFWTRVCATDKTKREYMLGKKPSTTPDR